MRNAPNIIKRAKVAEFLGLGDLPYQLDVPTLGSRDGYTVAVSAATVDDLALALVGMRAEAGKFKGWRADLTLHVNPNQAPGRLADALGVDDDLARVVYLRARDEVDARLRALEHDADVVSVMYDAARRAGALGADNALDALFEAASAAESADANKE